MTVADHTTDFDKWLVRAYAAENSPTELIDGLKDMADTLHGAWLAVQCEFGEKAQPEHAIALLGFALSSRNISAGTQQAGVVADR